MQLPFWRELHKSRSPGIYPSQLPGPARPCGYTSRMERTNHIPDVASDDSDGSPELVAIAAVCELIPSRVPGKRLAPSTVLRWITSGRLTGRKIAGGWYVTREDLDEFIRGREPVTSRAKGKEKEGSKKRKPVASRGHKEAERRMRRRGILK